jgi:hypothetical protein
MYRKARVLRVRASVKMARIARKMSSSDGPEQEAVRESQTPVFCGDSDAHNFCVGPEWQSDVAGEAFEGARDRYASAEETETGKQMRASCM